MSETNELTVAFALPYERRTAARILAELDAHPRTALTGLLLAVDHRCGSRRAWLLVTFDLSDPQGQQACADVFKADAQGQRSCTDVLKAYAHLSSDVTLDAVFEMAERGECNFASFAGTEADRVLFDSIWPAGFTANEN